MERSWQDWQDSYNYLTLHLVPGPRSFTYFVPFLAVPLVLGVPPSRLPIACIRLLILPALVSIQIWDWNQHQSFDVISMNHVLMMFMLLGWYDVRKDFKHVVRDSNVQKYQLHSYPEAIWPRLHWIGLLIASLRLTDWHIGMLSHDKRQPSSIHPFKSYFLNTLAHSAFSYVLLAYTNSSGICSNQSSLIFLARLYAILALYNSLLPTLIVLCSIAPLRLHHNSMISPLTWHSHFGSFSSIYEGQDSFGLRAFWGIFWHQNMRHLTSTPGIALASWFRLSGTKRYMIIVCSSFFWSGIVHMGVIPAEPLHGSALQLRLQLATFFWLQPLGIGMEMLLDSLSKNRDKTKSTEAAGYQSAQSLGRCILKICWTCAFLAITAEYTIRPVGCTMNWWNLPFLSVPRLI